MKRIKQTGKARVVASAQLPTRFGRFTISGIEGSRPGEEAVAIQHGRLRPGRAALVRIHSQCLTGDVFTSERCDCRAQLELSLRKIAKHASGVVLYLPQEGRGIGLLNKLRAFLLRPFVRQAIAAGGTAAMLVGAGAAPRASRTTVEARSRGDP